MPKATHCFKAHSPIIDLQVLPNDTIIFSTTDSGIRVVDKDEYTVISNILPQEIDRDTKTFFSPDGKLVALVKHNIIHIMVLKNQKIFKTIKIIDGKICTLHFDHTSNYLIVGTSEGRVLQYRYNSNTQISRLCSFPHYLIDEKPKRVKNNFVSAITSYKDKIACSGYGGAIFVLNLHSRDNRIVINRSRAKVQILCFVNENTLVSGDIDGVLEIIDLNHPKKIRRLNAPFTDIKHITVMPNKDYILVASDKNFISLINIKTLKVIDNKYLEFDGKIKKLIKQDEKSLLAVIDSKSVESIELLHLGTLRNLIQNDKLYQAYKLLIKAPMLRGSQEEKELEIKYQDIIKQTIKHILNDDMFSARELTKNLRSIPSKKDEIDLVFTAFKHYDKLKLMFHEQKLNIAYSICEKYPALKYTREYKSMEKRWHEKFIQAEKEMILNNIDSARVLLSEYMLVPSKRTLIQFILYKNKEFISFLKAIENKEFQQITDLAKEHHNFTTIHHYKSFHEELENNLEEAKRLIKIGNTHLAQILIDKLEENPKYEETIQILQKQCDDVVKLYALYNEDKLQKSYIMIDKNKFLKSTDLGMYLEEKWYQLINQCEKYALKGELEKLEDTLGELKFTISRADKVGDLLRLAYTKKISYFILKKEFKNAQVFIHNYTKLFGLDAEINRLIKQYASKSNEKIKLTSSQARHKPRDFWLFS